MLPAGHGFLNILMNHGVVGDALKRRSCWQRVDRYGCHPQRDAGISLTKVGAQRPIMIRGVSFARTVRTGVIQGAGG